MAAPVHLTDQEFDAFVAKHPLVVVDFWAEWCGPCKAIDPIIKDLAEKYDGKVAFAKVDADENPVKIRMYGIMGIPTLLVFKGGKLVDSVVGAVPKATLEARLQKHL
ncbi:MAG: thioredoxin [Euryarchaeota archaeon]|nr:thioredoxin [Euryarchaeota archaeon]